ncbi:hypothetical protein [Staphylococcus phage ZCSS1]|uniref:Phage PVL protein n=1 Tax=Staphylococcus phage UHP46 TaxID=3234966 RepID=A0AB39C804_9CAUD|nr:hypothetical protein [Staphylococcus phage ZCSS1]
MSTVTIKVKELMSLDETIKYAWENDIRSETYFSEDEEGIYVNVDKDGDISIGYEDVITPYELFVVEKEVSINESNVIPKLLVKRKSTNDYKLYEDDTIESFGIYEGDNDLEAFYMVQKDKTLTLLWKDGEMIEGGM